MYQPVGNASWQVATVEYVTVLFSVNYFRKRYRPLRQLLSGVSRAMVPLLMLVISTFPLRSSADFVPVDNGTVSCFLHCISYYFLLSFLSLWI